MKEVDLVVYDGDDRKVVGKAIVPDSFLYEESTVDKAVYEGIVMQNLKHLSLDRGCSTENCPGDNRYSAPGRGHISGCNYPSPEEK